MYIYIFHAGLGYQNGNNNDIADTAIKALEGGALLNNANGNPSKSTLIIHSVQRVSGFCGIIW